GHLHAEHVVVRRIGNAVPAAHALHQYAAAAALLLKGDPPYRTPASHALDIGDTAADMLRDPRSDIAAFSGIGERLLSIGGLRHEFFSLILLSRIRADGMTARTATQLIAPRPFTLRIARLMATVRALANVQSGESGAARGKLVGLTPVTTLQCCEARVGALQQAEIGRAS